MNNKTDEHIPGNLGHDPAHVQNKTTGGWDDAWGGIESYGFLMGKENRVNGNSSR